MLNRSLPVQGSRTVPTLTAQAPPVARLSARRLVAPSLRESVVTGSDRRSTTEEWVFGFDLGGGRPSPSSTSQVTEQDLWALGSALASTGFSRCT